MKLGLCFPHEYIEERPVGDDLVTIEWCEGSGWPNTIIGPDPTDIEFTSEWLSDQAVDALYPMSEEATIVCARAAEMNPAIRALPMKAALSCAYRHRLRTGLETAGLNPPWCEEGMPPPFSPPWVIKAPASALSLGVEIAGGPLSGEALAESFGRARRKAYIHISRLKQALGGEQPIGIVEQYVVGEQYCVSGIYRDKHALAYAPLRQIWDDRQRFIFEYEPVMNPDLSQELVEVGATAAEALGMQWCAYNFEVRGEPGHFKVIDAHARLGEDDGNYGELMGLGVDPQMTAIDILRTP